MFLGRGLKLDRTNGGAALDGGDGDASLDRRDYQMSNE